MRLRTTYAIPKYAYVLCVVLLLISSISATRRGRKTNHYRNDDRYENDRHRPSNDRDNDHPMRDDNPPIRDDDHQNTISNDNQDNADVNNPTVDSSQPSQSCHWGEWSEWSKCSQLCGAGVNIRKKFCMCSSEPSESSLCESSQPVETSPCNTNDCCRWSGYSEWSNCTKTCGGGKRIKTQLCHCPEYAIKYGLTHLNGCTGFPRTIEKSCNEQSCCRWEYSQWTECSNYCSDDVRSRDQTCVCTAGGSQTGCSGEPKKEEIPCHESRYECPHDVQFWDSTSKSWPLPKGTTFKCKSKSHLDDKSWKEILSSDDSTEWFQLAKRFIATKLSLKEGSYSTPALDEALDRAINILNECDRQPNRRYTEFLELYLSGKLDPRSEVSLEEFTNSLGFGAVDNLDDKLGKVLERNGNGEGTQEFGNSNRNPSLISLFVVAPTVTVAIIILIVAIAIFYVKKRQFKNKTEATEQELAELQKQIDKRNQEESGDDVDVDELEELKL